MKKLIVKHVFMSTLLVWLAACGNNSSSTSLGTLTANGPGINGDIPAGSSRLYTLQGINKNQTYTLRTEIPVQVLSDGSIISDGTLTVTIYSSEDAFKNNQPAEPIAVTPSTNFIGVYEGYFAAASSGDYVVVLQGASSTIPGEQFFYDLRIMSAYPTALLSFTTTTVPALALNFGMSPGAVAVFNGGTVSPAGTYSINLTTSVTSTVAYPQIFVYKDSSLTLDALLYSSVTDSFDFIITDFTTNPATTRPPDTKNNITNGVSITGVPFTSGTTTGSPFIMIKGTTSVTYSLSVTP